MEKKINMRKREKEILKKKTNERKQNEIGRITEK